MRNFGLLLLLSVLLIASPLLSHPGKRSQDGCHFCRTDCNRWKVAWNQRHCHEEEGSGKTEKSVRVIRVIDGDTVLLSNKETVRLIGIDAPEKGWEEKGIRQECYHRESAQFLEDSVLRKWVRIEPDPKGNRRDKHGRLLAYLYRDTLNVNAKMVKEGFARALTAFPFSKKQEFKALQEEARRDKRGLWYHCVSPRSTPSKNRTL